MGRNAERDFHGEKRANDTHSSTTDPDARLFRKASLVLAGSNEGVLATTLGTIAVACAVANIVGGFLITDRMLAMFERTPTATEAQQERDGASSVAKS